MREREREREREKRGGREARLKGNPPMQSAASRVPALLCVPALAASGPTRSSQGAGQSEWVAFGREADVAHNVRRASCQSPTCFLRGGLLCSCGCMRVNARAVRCELTCGGGSAGEADGRALDQSRLRCCRHPRSCSPLFSSEALLSLLSLLSPLPAGRASTSTRCQCTAPSRVNFLGSRVFFLFATGVDAALSSLL